MIILTLDFFRRSLKIAVFLAGFFIRVPIPDKCAGNWKSNFATPEKTQTLLRQ